MLKRYPDEAGVERPKLDCVQEAAARSFEPFRLAIESGYDAWVVGKVVESTKPSFLSVKRAGPRPRTTPTNPHSQLDQNAPHELQEKLFAIASTLDGVAVGPSMVSVPGARAFHLPTCAHAPGPGAFMVEREFAHLHPPRDGSLHMSLPVEIVDTVIANGWAERHPLSGKFGLPNNIVMVYGPRDDAELAIVADLVRTSHAHACPRS